MSDHVTIVRTGQGKPAPAGREELEAAVEARPGFQARPCQVGTLEITRHGTCPRPGR